VVLKYGFFVVSGLLLLNSPFFSETGFAFQSDQDAFIKYQPKSIEAPILQGTLLRVFVFFIETRPFSWLLTKFLYYDNHFHNVRKFTETIPYEVPKYFPSKFPTEAQTEYGLKNKNAKAELLTKIQENRKKREFFHSIEDYSNAYRLNTTTPTQIAKNLIVNIGKSLSMPLKALCAFNQYNQKEILKQAEESTKRYEEGKPLSIFDGVPVAVKDEMDVSGYRTYVGTKFLGKEFATSDAEVVKRLKDAGAIIVGKTNMHEIGVGVTGANPWSGITRSPFNLSYHSGGSSAGCGAAVGSGLVPVCIGADGGGSVRIPASFCGTVGLKATFGRISEVGAFPLCWTVAHIGPLTATVRDTALTYMLIAGEDSKDENTKHQPIPTFTTGQSLKNKNWSLVGMV